MPDIPLYWVQPFEDAVAQSLWFVRVFGAMFMIFGFVALFLASVGLYAVMSFSVSRRTREVGIRMALGAQGRDVVGMIFGQGLWQLGIGMAVGLTLALGISQLLKIVLFQVQPRDPVDLRRRGRRVDRRWAHRLFGARSPSNAGRSARRAAKRLIVVEEVRKSRSSGCFATIRMTKTPIALRGIVRSLQCKV